MTLTWPVFVTVRQDAHDGIRGCVSAAVVQFWLRHREAHPVVVLDAGAQPAFWRTLMAWGYEAGPDFDVVRLPDDDSQRQRHIVAQRLARETGATHYLATDDDIVPRPEFSVATAIGLMQRFQKFAMVAALLSSCTLPHVVKESAVLVESAPIAACGSCGGLRVWRADADWSPLPPNPSAPRAYDSPLYKALIAAGHEVGYFTASAPRSLRVSHFPGGAYSTVFPCSFVPAEFPRPGHAENG